jgi:hypothetical protein
MDSTFTTDDTYVTDYNDDPVMERDSVKLFDGQYAYDTDSDLREYHDGTSFIRTIHPYELINGSFYHPDDENKPEETTEDYSEPLTTITAHPTTGVTTSSNIIISSSTASTGTYSFYHPSQISGYLDTPITLGDIARSLEESAQINQITEVTEVSETTQPTETTETTETTESPDQFLI